MENIHLKLVLLLILIVWLPMPARSQSCNPPNVLEMLGLTTIDLTYEYTGNDPALVLTMEEFKIIPSSCTYSLSCVTIEPVDEDICNINTADTQTSFDAVAGVLTIAATTPTDIKDTLQVPRYVVQIVATGGTDPVTLKTVATTFNIKFEAPCLRLSKFTL